MIFYKYNERYKYFEHVGSTDKSGAQDEIINFSAFKKEIYAIAVNSGYYNIGAFPQTCYSLKVTTSPAIRDIGISSIITPGDLVAKESFAPRFYLRNKGNVTLSDIILKYRIDNEAEKEFLSNLTIYPNDSALITLNTFTNYTEGAHTFSVKAELLAGLSDADTTNNQKTISFNYKKLCDNNYEPNNEFLTATNVELDSTYFAQLATNNDIDYYRFRTTNQKPIIDIILKNDGQDYVYPNLYVVNNAGNYNSLYLNVTDLSGFGKRLRYDTDQAGTYLLGLSGSTRNSNNCYDFKISALAPVLDIALRKIDEPSTDTINSRALPPQYYSVIWVILR
ncbi:MAG: hypothetical protein HC817_09880 [Saprospiraceae bacterium]|nr:hypothetical protein [Saprospiraceae bacterium]